MRWMWMVLVLGGCVMGPNYRSPVVEICQEWVAPSGSEELTLTDRGVDCSWWENFNDPLLNGYIALAVSHNNDVLAAEWNIFVARSVRQEKQSAYFPQISGDINATRTGYSKNGPLFYIDTLSNGSTVPKFNVPLYQSLYNMMFDASWEMDLFGNLYRGVEVAERQYESTIENRNDILVSVLAEVAKNYVEVRAAQKKLSLVNKNIEFLERNALLTKERQKRGLDNDLDVLRIEGELETLQATKPPIETSIYAGIYSLSVLIGNDPQGLLSEMLPPCPMPELVKEIAPGLRSDLLLRRPDVRRAERNLAAAVAEIGLATTAFFPSFSLIGNVGLQSIMLRNLFEGRSGTFAYGFDFNFPVFQGGNLIAKLRAAESNARSVAYQYQQTVLNALKETEQSILTYAEDLEAIDLLKGAVDKNRKLRDLSFERYQKGLVNLMDFLDRENDLIATEDNLIDNEMKGLIDLIALYKSLGGGWECPPCFDSL